MRLMNSSVFVRGYQTQWNVIGCPRFPQLWVAHLQICNFYSFLAPTIRKCANAQLRANSQIWKILASRRLGTKSLVGPPLGCLDPNSLPRGWNPPLPCWSETTTPALEAMKDDKDRGGRDDRDDIGSSDGCWRRCKTAEYYLGRGWARHF